MVIFSDFVLSNRDEMLLLLNEFEKVEVMACHCYIGPCSLSYMKNRKIHRTTCSGEFTMRKFLKGYISV